MPRTQQRKVVLLIWSLISMISIGAFAVYFSACGGDPTVTNKFYECQDDKGCAPAEVCEKGKCVKSDDDDDGWSSKRGDCDDKNKSVFPGAPEICDNKIDDNCNGTTDEQPCQCLDGKKRECGIDVGACKKGTQSCTDGVWGKCLGLIEPTDEKCDGIDNNCDGSVDEGVKDCCQPKETKECGSDIGACKKGTQKCDNGRWTECFGEIKGLAEQCNGKDNDCDGYIDNAEKGKATPLSEECYSGPASKKGIGECKVGKKKCLQGSWGKCEGSGEPQKDDCDGKDNDCDGKVDNVPGADTNLKRTCYTGDQLTRRKGTCKDGVQQCSSGLWTSCQGEVLPQTEQCNGKDDDCDGAVDNIKGKNDPISKKCYNGPAGTIGTGRPCKEGKQLCKNGRWDSCQGAVIPQIEDCNGKDDDCDGAIDNQKGTKNPLGGSCYTGPKGTAGKGLCKAGTRKCISGKWTTCVGQVLPKAEICDGADNNCNGKHDDNVPGIGGSCVVTKYKSNTPCYKGKRECVSGKVVCRQQVFPKTETCNGIDDNCDGSIDNRARSLMCQKGYECRSGRCTRCSQPSRNKCPPILFGSGCRSSAKCPSCRCGFTCYCSETFALGICKYQSCR